MTFEEYWHEQKLPAASGNHAETLVCFLAKPEHKEIVAKAVKKLAPETRMVFISQGDQTRPWQKPCKTREKHT